MEDFDPERSAREMRKMNRRIYREKYAIYWLPQRFNFLFTRVFYIGNIKVFLMAYHELYSLCMIFDIYSKIKI